jgi:predicted permease
MSSHLFRQDVRHAGRVMWHARGVTAIAVLSLAIGIGANTAIFSVMHALLWRPLPIPHPETLVSLSSPAESGAMSGVSAGEQGLLTYHDFESLRDSQDALDAITAFGSETFNLPVTPLPGDVSSARATVSVVSGSYFAALGLVPAQGRFFDAGVDRSPGANPAAVISDRYWRTALQADPRAVGRGLRIRATTFTIVGILPAGFTGLVVGEAPDLFVPLTMMPVLMPGPDWLTQPAGRATRIMFLHVVGRLKAGVSLSQANASLGATFKRRIAADASTVANPDIRKQLETDFIVVRDARRGLSPMRAEYSSPLFVVFGLVGLLLLLACANVANLLLARTTARRRELAMRVALGASRWRVVRQMLTESLALAALGTAAGLWLSRLGIATLVRLVSEDSTPVPLDTHLDLVVMGFTAGVMALAGLLFGVAPALRATRLDVSVVLRGSAANVTGARAGAGRWPIAKALAAVQIALSLLLVVTAGLFVRSLQNLSAVPVGYEARHLLEFNVNPAPLGYSAATVRPFYDSLMASLGAVPGVQAVTLSSHGLFQGSDAGDAVSFPDDRVPTGLTMGARFDDIGPGYFRAVGVPIRSGRDVEAGDAAGGPSCWLGETMRNRFFPGGDPVGHRMVIHYSFGDAACEIRGVVADTVVNSPRASSDARFYTAFFNAANHPLEAVFLLRVTGTPSMVVPGVRSALSHVNSSWSAESVQTVQQLIDMRLTTDRLTARLSSLFSLLSLVLAAVGLYGVVSYSVARRTSEIGLRMALGADAGRVLRLILSEALAVTGLGVVAGLVAAAGTTRVIEGMLFQVSARDPLTLVAGPLVLGAVALFAAALPAWRASRTDPLVALRAE